MTISALIVAVKPCLKQRFLLTFSTEVFVNVFNRRATKMNFFRRSNQTGKLVLAAVQFAGAYPIVKPLLK